jgi:hypothetical protein
LAFNLGQQKLLNFSNLQIDNGKINDLLTELIGLGFPKAGVGGQNMICRVGKKISLDFKFASHFETQKLGFVALILI